MRVVAWYGHGKAHLVTTFLLRGDEYTSLSSLT